METHAEIMKCAHDDDCDHGYFCYKTGFCAKCTDCSVYKRMPGEQPCVHHPQNCGPCLPGFEPVIFSGNVKKDSCELSTRNIVENGSDNLLVLSSVATVIFCAVVVVCVYRKYFKKIAQKITKQGPSMSQPSVLPLFHKNRSENEVSDGQNNNEPSAPVDEEEDVSSPFIPDSGVTEAPKGVTPKFSAIPEGPYKELIKSGLLDMGESDKGPPFRSTGGANNGASSLQMNPDEYHVGRLSEVLVSPPFIPGQRLNEGLKCVTSEDSVIPEYPCENQTRTGATMFREPDRGPYRSSNFTPNTANNSALPQPVIHEILDNIGHLTEERSSNRGTPPRRSGTSAGYRSGEHTCNYPNYIIINNEIKVDSSSIAKSSAKSAQINNTLH